LNSKFDRHEKDVDDTIVEELFDFAQNVHHGVVNQRLKEGQHHRDRGGGISDVRTETRTIGKRNIPDSIVTMSESSLNISPAFFPRKSRKIEKLKQN
jgi:hypothetical protein